MICFFSDTELTIEMYRSALIDLVSNNGYTVRKSTLSKLWSLRFLFSAKIIISSNMRANLISLLLFWKRKLVIVNGLGRYRQSKYYRRVLLCMILCNRRSVIVFQNYADFRFYRRYAKKANLRWVPGSGGSNFGARALKCRKPNKVALVSRDSKILLQKSSILAFAKQFPELALRVYGLRSEMKSIAGIDFENCGFVERDVLVAECEYHFSPSGYGEGVPHTLVDAVCNKLTIVIEKRDLIRYGLHKYLKSYHSNGIFCVIEHSVDLSEALLERSINVDYYQIFHSLVSCRHKDV